MAKFYAAAFRCEATNCENNKDDQCMRYEVILDSNGHCSNCTIQTQKAKEI